MFLFLITALAMAQSKVLVVDTGANLSAPFMCPTGHVDMTGTGFADNVEHGQIVVNIIAKKLPKGTCIIMFKWTNKREPLGPDDVEAYNKALMEVIKKETPVLINMSYAGEAPAMEEMAVIDYVINHTAAQLVIAAGNNKKNLTCTAFPACYMPLHPRFHIATSRYGKSNRGINLTLVEPTTEDERNLLTSGTSFAAAILTGRLLSKE